MKYTLTVNKVTDKVNAMLDLIRLMDEIELQEESNDFQLSDSYKRILDERVANHLNGTSKSFSWEEVKESARGFK